MGLFGGNNQETTLTESEQRCSKLESDCHEARLRLARAEDLVRHLGGDRDLLLSALERLRPGLEVETLAQDLMDVCFKPLGLACFFVAMADWEEDLLRFVLYHEGGCARQHPSRKLSDRAGLSERVLRGNRAFYIRTTDEGHAAGSLLTPTEQATGLIPHSWYGVPLGWGPKPLGLVSFQSFESDAFGEDRRRVMDALGALMSTCLSVPVQAR